MISPDQATQAALLHMEESRVEFEGNHPGDDLALAKIVEFTNGWLFFFNSKIYLETSNILDNLIGLGPVIVDNMEGIVYQAGSYGTESSWIEEFNEFLQGRE